MKGPPPKPTKLKLVTGNPGKRALNKSEPEPPPGDVECPDTLLGAAKEEWNRIAPILLEAGLFTKADRAALLCYCQAFANTVEYEKLCREVGPDLALAKGFRKAATVAAGQVRAFAAEFGMTPASRSRVTTSAGGSAKSKFEDFRRRRGA